MPMFEDREKVAERRFEQAKDLAFKIVARRNKLLGLWAASHMGLSSEDAARYAMGIVEAEVAERDDDAIVKKIADDLVTRGYPIVEQDVRAQLRIFSGEARAELAGRMVPDA